MFQLRKIALRTLQSSFGKLRKRSVTELEPFDAYQLWAPNYDKTEGNALVFAEESIVRPMLKTIPIQGKAVLDAACGVGRYFELLHSYRPRIVVGMDFSPRMIEQAIKKLTYSSSTSLQLAKLEHLPFREETFDFLLCTLALDHVQVLHSAVAELSRVLRSGGSMIISSFHPHGKVLGWQRSFCAKIQGGRSRWYAVKYYPHPRSSYSDAFISNNLDEVNLYIPIIDESIRPYYEQARRLDLYYRIEGSPLLLIYELRKQ